MRVWLYYILRFYAFQPPPLQLPTAALSGVNSLTYRCLSVGGGGGGGGGGDAREDELRRYRALEAQGAGRRALGARHRAEKAGGGCTELEGPRTGRHAYGHTQENKDKGQVKR